MAKLGEWAAMWSCLYCETEDIWGYIFECTGCGVCRPKGVRFYLPDNAPLLTQEQVDLMGSNPNWYCEYCESGNPSTKGKCWECGADKGSSSTHRRRVFRSGVAPSNAKEAKEMALHKNPFHTPTGVTAPPPVSREANPYQQTYPQTYTTTEPSEYSNDTPGKSIFGNIATILATIAAVSIIGVLIYQFFFNTHEELVQISGFNWTQNITVQEYQVAHESSWGSHPNDAYNITEDYLDTGRDEKIHDGYHMEPYEDTCYEDEYYQDTCYDSKYVSKSCPVDNGDGSYGSEECGGYVETSYSCTKTRQKAYSCTKEEQVEDYHYEDIYDWYYEYDIDKWITIQNYPTSGSDHSPYYETNFTLNQPYSGLGNPQVGQQQQFQIPGEYTVTFFCKDNIKIGKEGYFTRSHPLEAWEAFDARGVYTIEVNTFNSILTYPSP